MVEHPAGRGLDLMLGLLEERGDPDLVDVGLGAFEVLSDPCRSPSGDDRPASFGRVGEVLDRRDRAGEDPVDDHVGAAIDDLSEYRIGMDEVLDEEEGAVL